MTAMTASFTGQHLRGLVQGDEDAAVMQHIKQRYKDGWRAEAVFCRLKDFRRVATCYNKLPSYVSALTLAAVVALWC